MENKFKATWLKTAGSPGAAAASQGRGGTVLEKQQRGLGIARTFWAVPIPHCDKSLQILLNRKIKYVDSWPTSLVSFILTGKGPFLPGNHLFKKPVRTGICKALWSYKAKTATVRKEKWSRSVVSDSLWPHGLYSPWNSPGQNTGVGSLSLLQRIFPTQGWNPGLPHCGWILYRLNHKGSPRVLEWVA